MSKDRYPLIVQALDAIFVCCNYDVKPTYDLILDGDSKSYYLKVGFVHGSTGKFVAANECNLFAGTYEALMGIRNLYDFCVNWFFFVGQTYFAEIKNF